MSDSCENEKCCDIYTITAKWGDGDNIDWEHILLERISSCGGDVSVVSYSPSEGCQWIVCTGNDIKYTFIFTINGFCYIGPHSVWLKVFNFIQMIQDQTTHKFDIWISINNSESPTWAKYTPVYVKFDSKNVPVPSIANFTTTYEISFNKDDIDSTWYDILCSIKASEDFEFIELNNDCIILLGDIRNSVWVFTKDIIIYTGYREYFLNSHNLFEEGEIIVVKNPIDGQRISLLNLDNIA